MLSNSENTLPSFHEKIRISKVREYDFKDIDNAIKDLIKVSFSFNDLEIVKKMREIVPEYHPNNTVYSIIDNRKN